MAQLSRGYTFIDGSTGNSSNLHALVDSGSLRPGAILDQSAAAPADADSILFVQSSTSTLKKGTITQVKALIPANAEANVASLRKLGTSPTMAAPGDDARFPARLTGIRKANGVAADTVADSADLVFHSKNLNGVTAIDWSLADIYYDTLTAPKTYTFTNTQDGKRILVRIKTAGNAVTWNYATVPGESKPVCTGAPNNIYFVAFVQTPAGSSGWIEKSF